MASSRKRRGLPSFALVRMYLPALGALILMLVLWEIITARTHSVAAYILPAPTDIAREIGIRHVYLLQQMWVTAREIVFGFILGTVTAIAFALAIFYSRMLRRTIFPFVLITQYVPKLAIAPLIIVWFGLDLWPKVVVTAMVCLFPIMINTLAGLRNHDARALELMYLLNASRWQTFWMIRLPSATPNIFAGLKVGISLATTGAIVAEWISADSGLGYVIVYSLGYFRITMLYAALVMLVALGLTMFGLVVLAERLLTPHRPALEIAGQAS